MGRHSAPEPLAFPDHARATWSPDQWQTYTAAWTAARPPAEVGDLRLVVLAEAQTVMDRVDVNLDDWRARLWNVRQMTRSPIRRRNRRT
jgi:hypothetical protein